MTVRCREISLTQDVNWIYKVQSWSRNWPGWPLHELTTNVCFYPVITFYMVCVCVTSSSDLMVISVLFCQHITLVIIIIVSFSFSFYLCLYHSLSPSVSFSHLLSLFLYLYRSPPSLCLFLPLGFYNSPFLFLFHRVSLSLPHSLSFFLSHFLSSFLGFCPSLCVCLSLSFCPSVCLSVSGSLCL